MKRIMFIAALLIGFSMSAEAQNYRGKVGGRDTLTNAATDTTRFEVTGNKSDFTIYVPYRKISGTVAGTVKYYYSIDDGVTYYLAETDTITDASNTYAFEKNYLPGNKWMVVTATTGTSVSSTEVWIRYNR